MKARRKKREKTRSGRMKFKLKKESARLQRAALVRRPELHRGATGPYDKLRSFHIRCSVRILLNHYRSRFVFLRFTLYLYCDYFSKRVACGPVCSESVRAKESKKESEKERKTRCREKSNKINEQNKKNV